MKHAKPVYLVRCPKYNHQTHRYEGHEWREVFRDSWSYRHHQSKGRHRKGTSYRRNPLHVKKDLSDHKALMEWKKRKKDWRHVHRSFGGKSYLQNQGHRARRRWEDRCIHAERYDDLSTIVSEIKLFIDPWDWD